MTGRFDVGHRKTLQSLAMSGDRVLSRDTQGGRWILWDTLTHKGLTSGLADVNGFVGLRGNLMAIQSANAIDLYNATTAQVQVTIPAALSTIAQSGLADDGSYFWAAIVGGGLKVWSAQGALLVNAPGDYSTAKVFAANTELRVAKGPAGANLIQRIPLDGSAATLSPTFSQTFNSWMQDGERFFAVVGNAVFIYSKTATLVASAALTTVEHLAGSGDYFWTFQGSTPGYPLRIYSVSSPATPITTYGYNSGVDIVSTKQGPIAMYSGDAEIHFVQLTPQAPRVIVPLPYAYVTHIAFDDATGRWAISNRDGVVYHHGNSQNAQLEASLGCGEVLEISTTVTGWAAIGFASNRVVILDMNNGGIINNIVPQWGEKLALSNDNSVLAVWEGSSRAQYASWFKIHVLSLPSGTETHVFPESNDFTMAENGSRIAYTERVTNRRYVMDTGGVTTFYSDNLNVYSEPVISPNGEMIAVPSSTPGSLTTTYLYHLDAQGGAAQLVNAVPGFPVKWLDGNRLFAYTMIDIWQPVPKTAYDKTFIYDAQGNTVANPAISVRIQDLDVVSASKIYDPNTAKVYDLNTGAATWTSPITPLVSAAVPNSVLMSYDNGVYVAPL